MASLSEQARYCGKMSISPKAKLIQLWLKGRSLEFRSLFCQLRVALAFPNSLSTGFFLTAY
jgi:hypothetical protein